MLPGKRKEPIHVRRSGKESTEPQQDRGCHFEAGRNASRGSGEFIAQETARQKEAADVNLEARQESVDVEISAKALPDRTK
jgi:hypothetical protein